MPKMDFQKENKDLQNSFEAINGVKKQVFSTITSCNHHNDYIHYYQMFSIYAGCSYTQRFSGHF